MNNKIKTNTYKIVIGEKDTVLFITEEFNAKIKKKVTFTFTNSPISIVLEDNGHLDKLKKLDTLIVVISDKSGTPTDILDLEILGVF